jgi:hypothetical protein
MADDETLKCMLAAQVWMHSIDTIEDIIGAVRTLPPPPPGKAHLPPEHREDFQRYMFYLDETNRTLKKITPIMTDCASIDGPLVGISVKAISDVAQHAADNLLDERENFKTRMEGALSTMVQARLAWEDLANFLTGRGVGGDTAHGARLPGEDLANFLWPTPRVTQPPQK